MIVIKLMMIGVMLMTVLMDNYSDNDGKDNDDSGHWWL